MPGTLDVRSIVEPSWGIWIKCEGNTVVVCLHSSASAWRADSKWGKEKKTGVRHLESLERFPLPHSLMAEAPVRGAQSQRGGRQIKAGIIVEVGER